MHRTTAVVSRVTEVAAPTVALAAAGGPLWRSMVTTGAATTLSLLADRVADRQAEVLVRAARIARLEQEELLSALDASPEKQELLVEIFEAARAAIVHEKLLALAATLASGATASSEGGEVARELMLVQAIADIESPHLAVLARLEQSPSAQVSEPAPGLVSTAYAHAGGWYSLFELRAMPGIGDVVEPILAVLERHGLVEPYEAEGGQVLMPHGRSCRLTSHGRLLLDRLHASDSDEA